MHKKPRIKELVYLFKAGMLESKEALTFARRQQKGHFHKDGKNYIVHPLEMARFAIDPRGSLRNCIVGTTGMLLPSAGDPGKLR